MRRTSSSFSHVRNNNLVSNSPFKLSSPQPSVSALAPKLPSRIPTPTQRRISQERRRISLERKAKFAESGENARPIEASPSTQFRRRQSKGLNVFENAGYVSKSPFRASVSEPILSSSSEQSLDPPDSSETDSQQELEDVYSTPRSSAAHAIEERRSPRVSSTPPLPQLAPSTPPRIPELPTPRSNLVSRRLHGPRSTSGTSTRRARSKTVTWDERCDVVEFDVESFEGSLYDDEGDESFQSDYEVEYDPNRRVSDVDEIFEDSNVSDRDESYMSDPEGERGYVSSLLAREEIDTLDNHPSSPSPRSPRPSRSPRPTTPPSQVAVPPPAEETEDGVPYGRSHHIERLRAARQGSPLPSTPARNPLGDRPTSPSPARALPRPPLREMIEDEDSQGEGSPTRGSPLAPLALSPSRSFPHSSTQTFSDPFAPANESPRPLQPRERSLSPVRPSSSLGSLEREGSLTGRSSPRIDREEVRKRLLRSKASPASPANNDGEDASSPSASSPVVEPLRTSSASPTRPPAPLPAARPLSSASFDLNQPGVDLGDVRSALDRLMIGVERGFSTDDVSSIGGSRDVSFAEGDSSMMMDRSMTEADHDEEQQDHSVFITSHLSQTPAISPPSPLLTTTQMPMMMMNSAPSDSSSSPKTAATPLQRSSTSSASTATTEDETSGPETPSVQSALPIPPVSITSAASYTTISSERALSTIEEHRVHSPFASREKKQGYGVLGAGAGAAVTTKKDKALPATPQPRISLDFSSGFTESSFGDFGLGLSSDVVTDQTRVPSSSVPPPRQEPVKPALSGKEAIRAHEEAILARRRELRREMDGEDRYERPQRRRSQSTSDALDFGGRESVCSEINMQRRISH